MKIFLNSNFQLERIEDTLDQAIIKGSVDFDELKIYIPIATKESFTTIYPTYSVKRADNRELGPYATINTADATEAGYYGWKGVFNPRDLAVRGPLEITFAFVLNGTIKKTVAKVTTNVSDAISVSDDLLILGDGQAVESALASISTFMSALSSKADLSNDQQTILTKWLEALAVYTDDVYTDDVRPLDDGHDLTIGNGDVTYDSQTKYYADEIKHNVTRGNEAETIIEQESETITLESVTYESDEVATNSKIIIDGGSLTLYSNGNTVLIDNTGAYLNNSLILSQSDIIDALNSTATNKALSAKQGKVLKDLADNLQSQVDELADNVGFITLQIQNWNAGNFNESGTLTEEQIAELSKETCLIKLVTGIRNEWLFLKSKTTNMVFENIKLTPSSSISSSTKYSCIVNLTNYSYNLTSTGVTFYSSHYMDNKVFDLQTQIDGINAGQNLADIVADLTALNNLDTSKLKPNDKVQVLVDSDHDDASTVYNWNGSTWDYIGKYGQDSYTKAETNALLDETVAGLQPTISPQYPLYFGTGSSSNKLYADACAKITSTFLGLTVSKIQKLKVGDYINLGNTSGTGDNFYIKQISNVSNGKRYYLIGFMKVNNEIAYCEYAVTTSTNPVSITDATLTQTSLSKKFVFQTIQDFETDGGSSLLEAYYGDIFNIEGINYFVVNTTSNYFTLIGLEDETIVKYQKAVCVVNPQTGIMQNVTWSTINLQTELSGSTSVDITSNVVSVKDSYITGQFLTDAEMTTLLSEVFD